MSFSVDMFDWQKKVVRWVTSRLGDAAMDPHERGMRFGEEAVELLHAVGITEDEVVKLVYHVYKKPVGEIYQEIGGAVTTLLALSDSQNIDMNMATLKEIDRIYVLPPERFQKRQALNAELGIGKPAVTHE